MSIFIIISSFISLFSAPLYLQDSLMADVISDDTRPTFSESLAEYVSGVVLDQEDNIENGKAVISSVVWIPTYYGYHSFIGVLDTYIQNQTSISGLRTRRLAADRNHYVIMLSDKDVSVKIIYDTVNSLLFMSAPPGY
jgi:hypothetical protein